MCMKNFYITLFLLLLGRNVLYSQESRSYYMSLKTNALYDLLAIPNLGAEFYLGSNFSVATNWHYAWWKNDKKHDYWRTYGGDLAVRYWLGKAAKAKPLTGHHVGIYGQALAYDLQVGNIGQQTTTINMSAGVEYGYSFPVAPGLNVDVELGFGYLTGKYFEYNLNGGHDTWRGTVKRAWIGPTKASVSLVWLIKSKKNSINR